MVADELIINGFDNVINRNYLGVEEYCFDLLWEKQVEGQVEGQVQGQVQVEDEMLLREEKE